MVYDWDAHQQTCYRLYIQEGKSLEDIMEHMKNFHQFTPSKRAFQSQFRRWDFPPKQQPAYKNERLVCRIKELWGENLAQQEMLRVLNEEGFDVRARELMRVRTRNRWLLRVPRALEDECQTDEGESRISPAGSSAPGSSARNEQPSSRDHETKTNRRRSRRKSSSAGARAGSTDRFPSEMTLDEARLILRLDVAAYRAVRTHFQQVCQEENIIKKTTAGVDKWDAAKARLHSLVWSTKENPEPPQRLALDVICTDVTKRMRVLKTRMTLAEARNVLGVDPAEAREMRRALRRVLTDSGFTCKSDATPQQWEELKRTWADGSTPVRHVLRAPHAQDGISQPEKARALDVMAMDIIKRFRDDGGQKEPGKQELPPSPAVSPPRAGQRATAAAMATGSSAHDDQMDLADAMANSNFDALSEVSHPSQMAFSPASSAMGAPMPASLRPQTPGLPGSQERLPRPSRVFVSPPMSAGMPLGPPMSSSLLLGPNTQATFLHQQYLPSQFAAAATPAPVFQPAHPAPVSPACAIYMRAHPSSSFVPSPSLWIATLNSQSIHELRQAAASKFPGAICARVEGILRDGKGGELPLPIEQDDELSAYLAHLQGAAPTFNVQLMWKSP
ncbi:uncharacterized protein UV8b_02362 [Ustilaginoidea virens]|uniref:Clr5 domain-containing protein n=1 Tax=Ustilaginoidea virens TaxID=1159556 RepID=A0A8E5MFM3_USTVR|nr:uncharacterized protein UV8b_02362 [Ustilaginoidea virens]QUC18121.1 hypothetical protein UV8b_02362 [Ustilaginoidea virens]